MRVAVYHGGGDRVTIEEVDDPRPSPGQLVVKVGRCGICGTDIARTSGSTFDYEPGRRLGHEYAGEIVEVGRDVVGLRVGDRVMCAPMARCGECENCVSGHPVYCTGGMRQPGGFGDFVLAMPSGVIALPDGLSLAEGALVEPIACGLRALRLAAMRGGERVLVLGSGSMAAAVVYWARVMGAVSIVVLARSPERAEPLLAMGADRVCRFDEDPRAIVEACGGQPDIVVECIGKPGMLAKAIDHVRICGAVLSMGMCMHNDFVLPYGCSNKEIRLFFPLAYTHDELIETVRAFDAGRVSPEVLVREVITLDELPDAIEGLRDGTRSQKIQVDLQMAAARG